jgi:hypothetical protein
MPNECSNHLTIISDSENDIFEIVKEIHNEIPDATLNKHSKGIRVTFITAWKPHTIFIENLFHKYPLIWIKNEWISEDGKAGIYVGKKNNIKIMEWDDLSFEAEHFYLSN